LPVLSNDDQHLRGRFKVAVLVEGLPLDVYISRFETAGTPCRLITEQIDIKPLEYKIYRDGFAVKEYETTESLDVDDGDKFHLNKQ